ncbi:bleomycin resistance protein [Streptomonospora alba]|uniref:Bleomycin resistance protein n=1 Tax=Streptomonospora alba TaxID=183763 RepID=A0A0C2JIL8_9ACTN|nr:glyoxalase/bleomycin resistance/extradiol dioxygenase family protein [Streptomonospora alba]KIH98735.1 bleomycin resistance protein [Streptomonospora alba]
MEAALFLGLRTIVYPAADLAASTRWYTGVLGRGPYFSEDYYVGFDVGGYELALQPVELLGRHPVTYWGVADVDTALSGLLAQGAASRSGVREVGGGIRVATVLDPQGSVLGLIENPHFRAGGEP